MNSTILTSWFDGEKFKPARIGVYMLLSGTNLGYQNWDGKKWGLWFMDASSAAGEQRNYAASQFQNDNWRGVLKTPNV